MAFGNEETERWTALESENVTLHTEVERLEALLRERVKTHWRASCDQATLRNNLAAEVGRLKPYEANAEALAQDVAEADRQLERLKAGLEDFRDHGTRHDVAPTIMVRLKSLFGLRDLGPPRTRGWYGYVKEMDDYVRQKARTVLEG